jgi:Tfp pilus assembly protein PilN
MIRINLLPEEYRRKSRTPIKLMVGLMLAVTVNTGLLAWLGWLTFGVAKEIDSQKQVLELEMEGLNPQVAYHHALEKEGKMYESRERTLASITSSRIVWTRKLDELIDVINRGDEGQRHLVWLDDLLVSQNVNPRNDSYGTLRASGHSGSDKFAQVANFLEDVENSPFIQDFYRPAPPEGTQTVVDETLVPPVVWAFPLSLSLKSPEEREAARKAKQEAASAGDKGDKGDKDKADAAGDAAATPTEVVR